MNFRSLFILPTNYCTFNCTHCAIQNKTIQRFDLNIDTVEKMIHDTPKLQFSKLVISGGGEPMTVKEINLNRILLASSKYNLFTRIVTNAYWAISPEETIRRLKPLAENGLKQIVISISESHQKYVKYDHILNAVKASSELGINCCLYLTALNVKTNPLKNIVRYFSHHHQQLPFIRSENYFIPFGNAENNFSISDFQLTDVENLRYACPSAGNNICVHPTGDVTFCAMVFALNVRALKIGNIYRSSLAEIILQAERNRLMQWLALHGIVALKEMVEQHTNICFSNKYVNICHLCGEMLLHPQVLKFLKQVDLID